MPTMIRQNALIALGLTGLAALTACAPAVVGGAAITAHDRRSVGTVFDDQSAEIQVIDRIYSTEAIGEESHIKVEVYEGVVLLMGETDTEAKRVLAAEKAAEVAHIEKVVNEIKVDERAGFGTKLNNSWLTAKINTTLLTKNPIPGFDPTRIKVISSDGTVFLMGLVTREEGEVVTEIVRNVRGVSRVVKVFNYIDAGSPDAP